MKDWLKYDDLIAMVSHLSENEKLNTKGLTLLYTIDPVNHRKLDETLFYKSNAKGETFKHRDTIEINVGGVNITIVEKKIEG